MKRAVKFSVFLTAVCYFLLISCKKEDNEVPAGAKDLPLTDSQEAFLATVKDTVIHTEDIRLENGQDPHSFLEENDPGFLQGAEATGIRSEEVFTPKLQKLLFFSRMFTMGEFLVNRSRHVYPEEGTDRPAQNGLAYCWGSKDYNKRQTSSVNNTECRNLQVYGLDCAGMLWAMTSGALLPPLMPKGSFCISAICDTAKWNKAFKASADYKGLKMKDLGQLSVYEMKNGDLILWSAHMGVFLNGFLYQSNGNTAATNCNENLLPSRGPRLIAASDVLDYGLGSYKVFRVESGNDYTLKARLNLTGFTNSGYCKLVDYIETGTINFTIEGDKLILNYIRNYDPRLKFRSDFSCTCQDMSFAGKSAVDFTNFTGSLMQSNYLWYDITYVLSAVTEKVKCGNSPVSVFAGSEIPDIHEQGPIKLPVNADDSTIVPLVTYFEGNLTITKDN